MSKILKLAQSYEQKSKEAISNTEQAVQADLENLKKNITAALKQSELNIIKDIQRQQNRLSIAVFSPYLWSLGALLVLGLVFLASNIYLVAKIKTKAETLAILEEQTYGIELTYCKTAEGERKVCALMDPKHKEHYGTKKKPYMILQSKLNKRKEK